MTPGPGSLITDDKFDMDENEPKFDEGFDTTPDKRTWAFFALSAISFVFTQIGGGEIAFIGFIGFFIAAIYSWKLHTKDMIERKEVVDTLEQI